MGFLTDFFGGIWVKIAAVGAIVVAVLAACAKLVSIGKTEAEAEGQKEQLKNVQTRANVDNAVASSGGDAVRNELRDKFAKP